MITSSHYTIFVHLDEDQADEDDDSQDADDKDDSSKSTTAMHAGCTQKT